MGEAQRAFVMNARDTGARDAMLDAIRAAGVPPAPPGLPMSAVAEPASLLEQFLRVLSEVGGMGVMCHATQTFDDAVEQIRNALGLADASALLVVRGRFAVAENAAVYIDAADLAERATIVRAEHVALTVSRSALVPTMHEAVRLMPRESSCGWFLSGPSKTADIEQSLVIGAQGARTLHVLIDNDYLSTSPLIPPG